MGKKESNNFDGWSKNNIGDSFFLYSHPDLSINITKRDKKEICILGYILDPFNPHYTNSNIMDEIIEKSECFNDVLTCTDKYSGRWVLIWKDKSGVKMMNDACGTRQIFFYIEKDEIWCGSQPSIIAYEYGLEANITPEINGFINSVEYKRECAWIGDGTIYENLWHMLPNHYLDLDLMEAKRFWPIAEIDELDMSVAVKEAAYIIRGTIISILYRFKNIMLSVTAGLDSRTNLAACKPIKERIKYIFCTDSCNRRNTDYRISSKLLDKLHLKQDIICLYDVDDRFTNIYNKNVTLASDVPSKRFIYSFYKELPEYIHVSGVGAGIAKSFYYFDNNNASTEKISKAANYKKSKYAESFIARWLEDAKGIKKMKTINIYDVFYWENRMGNWGAKSSAEQDIAIEETWPYNNRRLLETMLSVNAKYRKPPFYKFHKMVIKFLWEETLCMPINPNLIKKVYKLIKNFLNRIKLIFPELNIKMHREKNARI